MTLHEWLARILEPREDGARPAVAPQAAFEIALELERRAGALYRRYAARFARDWEVSTFWDALAHDEDTHATILEFSRNILSEVGSRQEVVNVNLPALKAFGKDLEEAGARVSQPDFTLQEALLVATGIESSEMDHVLDILSHLPDHPVVQKIIDDMHAGTGDHETRLRRFAEQMHDHVVPV